MSWRVAKSLDVLRSQVNALCPKRSKISDGTVGDLAHSKTKSEHNPDSNGVVRALDLTHDPANGFNARQLAECIVANKDPRVLYIISNGEIVSSQTSPWRWRKYTGKNSHHHHVHISVVGERSQYDSDRPWDLSRLNAAPIKDAKPIVERPVLKRGSKGEHVRILQSRINTSVDGDFGPKTESALRVFQKANGLVVDGICGQYTWEKLL